MMYFDSGVLQPVEVLEHARELLVLGGDVGWQQAAQAEHVALVFAERGALVQGRVAQQRSAARVPFGQGRQ